MHALSSSSACTTRPRMRSAWRRSSPCESLLSRQTTACASRSSRFAFFFFLFFNLEFKRSNGLYQGVYATLLASFRATSIYTLPTLNLMKNSASALFVLPGKQESEMSYKLTFGYVRMLAILLRKGVKEGSKVRGKAPLDPRTTSAKVIQTRMRSSRSTTGNLFTRSTSGPSSSQRRATRTACSSTARTRCTNYCTRSSRSHSAPFGK